MISICKPGLGLNSTKKLVGFQSQALWKFAKLRPRPKPSPVINSSFRNFNRSEENKASWQ